MSSSDVFPPGSKPVRMTREQLMAELARIAALVSIDDSMEGSIMWAWSDEPGELDVGGLYRVGNSEGQGGARILWET